MTDSQNWIMQTRIPPHCWDCQKKLNEGSTKYQFRFLLHLYRIYRPRIKFTHTATILSINCFALNYIYYLILPCPLLLFPQLLFCHLHFNWEWNITTIRMIAQQTHPFNYQAHIWQPEVQTNPNIVFHRIIVRIQLQCWTKNSIWKSLIFKQ